MSGTLILALAVPWAFWGVLIGLLIAGGRSWVNMLILPVGATLVLSIIAAFQPERAVLQLSVFAHLVLLVYFLGSYIAFRIREQHRKP